VKKPDEHDISCSAWVWWSKEVVLRGLTRVDHGGATVCPGGLENVRENLRGSMPWTHAYRGATERLPQHRLIGVEDRMRVVWERKEVPVLRSWDTVRQGEILSRDDIRAGAHASFSARVFLDRRQ